MKFSSIPGQNNIKRRLIQTVRESRISHAQLFFGPEGAGKLAMAIAYAQYINCRARTPEDSCGSCPSCIKYEKLIHPDLHFVIPVAVTKKVSKNPVTREFLAEWRELLLNQGCYVSLNDWYEKIDIENKQAIINADDCNEIVKALNYKAYESEYKVMIIWMVEKLFHSAAPKILKILEEPPDKTLFILISENHDQIIPTILSRTQPVKFLKVDDQAVLEVLRRRLGMPASELVSLVRQVDGNMILAGRIAAEQMDVDLFNRFAQWMRLCYQQKVAGLAEFTETIASQGRERQKSFLHYALRFIRECLLLPYTGQDSSRLHPEEKAFAVNFAPFIHQVNGVFITEELNRALFHIERNANPSFLFMDLSLNFGKLLKMKPEQQQSV
ncbi:MAG TPA: DNA polymerase III subunit delta [Bacteroidales bacterium]|nr:DNA polymerase III subunit delta [Bacteroidales bacterium]HNS45865.1 DNA polymerase III subunit delta [Bacteroidales bacterium]